MIGFNPASSQHISALLFGGTLKADSKEAIGVFKGGAKKGLEKFKNIKIEVKIKGLELKPLDEWKNKKEGVYKTNEEVLKVLASMLESKEFIENTRKDPIIAVGGKIIRDAAEIASIILKIRGLQKELSTYYESTKELIYDLDNCVHASFKNVATDTGRLGHSNPNVGNQPTPPSQVTKHFVSRFQNGTILSADYKSIEVRVEAEDCKDPNYLKDAGRPDFDPHTNNLAVAKKVDYEEAKQKVETGEWKKERSQIKGFTFSQQYLASIATTTKNSGLTEREVTAILNARKNKYPGLYKWHDRNFKEVEKNGYYISILGRRFYFQYKQGSFGGEYLSKNEIANYKTQGTAYDIVSIMMGKFWREKALYNRDKYLMINNVHDNIMLDCKEAFKSQAINDLKVLELWQEVCKNRFNVDWKVPLVIDIKCGSSWYECF